MTGGLCFIRRRRTEYSQCHKETIHFRSGKRADRFSAAAEGMELIKSNTVSVIVSDNMMPGMKGIDFLTLTKTISPDSVRILMTGYADLHAAIEAINSGEVF